MAKSNTAIIAAAGLGLAGAAFLFSRPAKAQDSQKDDKDDKDDEKDDKDDQKDDKLPDVQPGKDHATFGRPYVRGDEATNVRIAVQTKPIKHPVGLSRGTKPLADWLTNVAFWESYPEGPIVIPKKSEYASKWLRLQAAVRLALRAENKDPIPTGHQTIGAPYKPGRAFEQHNASEAVKHRPGAHPVGKKGDAKSADWLANVAFWESYPKGPVTISAKDRESSAAWLRIRELVKKEIAKGTNKTDDKKDSLFPTLGAPYRPGSDQEQQNAVIAVRTMPSHHPRGEARKSGQADADWLANIVFWESWPAAPTKLSKGSPLAPAWIRGRNYVIAELAKKKSTPTTTPTKKTTTPTTTPTKKTTTPTTTPTSPQGQANKEVERQMQPGALEANAKIVWGGQPDNYKGRTPKGDLSSKENRQNWFANVVYWGTWPKSPVVIPKGDTVNAKRWMQAKAAVQGVNKTNVDDLPKTKTTTPTTTTATGTPGDLTGNVAIAIRKTSAENDRANEAYWLTWPDSPRKIPKGDKANSKRWIAARDEVRRQAGTKVSGDDELRPPAFSALPKDSRESARELACAILAAEQQQGAAPATIAAYRNAYGQLSVPTAADKAAAERIMQHVKRTRSLWRSLPDGAASGLDPQAFRRIAAVLAGASKFRQPGEIIARINEAIQTSTAGDLADNAIAAIAHRAAEGGTEPSRAWFAARELSQ